MAGCRLHSAHGRHNPPGQLPIDPKTGEKQLGSIEEQSEQALDNVEAILKFAGSGLDRVIKATLYITDIALWEQVNVVYARVFGEHKSARVVMPVKELHFGFQIESEVNAIQILG